MSPIPRDPIVPDVSKILTTYNFEKTIRGSLERTAAKDAANARLPGLRWRLSLRACLARLRRFVGRGTDAIRRQYRERRR